MPGTRRAWHARLAREQIRLHTLHARLEMVREIKERMGLHAPKIEELGTRKMRAEHPELAADWDAMREARRQHEAHICLQEQRKKLQGQERKRRGRSHALDPMGPL